jgi:hypothetical protein
LGEAGAVDTQISITADTYTSLFEDTEREPPKPPPLSCRAPAAAVFPMNVFPSEPNDTSETTPDSAKGQVKPGGPPGDRTQNPRIKSPLLCQLS